MHRLPSDPELEATPADPVRTVSVADYLARTMAEVEERLTQHRVLLRTLLEGQSPAAEAAQRPTCLLLDCPRQRRLRNALVDVVEVLEETRRSFKSRQLEALRRRVVAALVDA